MSFTTEEMIAKYIELRDAKEAKNLALKAELEQINAAMATIESVLLDQMNTSGETNKTTPAGTAFIKTNEFVGMQDWETFFAFANSEQGGQQFFKKDVNKTAVQEYIEKNGVPPPGINYTAKREVQIRRPKT